ncbi:hypothetical protein [Vibrio splendidus]|uniref:hypothetical protein n=1 Tax=Vibrio splendidus TaxID=29497 RepID=UPI000C839BFB|nr:hypothetical protein [Vibrio splendidus]PMG53794.1 hypothetical protein BCU89_17485 [Vibrio splendidus]
MEICINERAFHAQLEKDEEVFALFENLIEMFEATSTIRNKKQLKRTRCLKDKEILRNLSISQYCHQLLKNKIPEQKKYNQLILLYFMKSPYLDAQTGLENVSDEYGECCKESSLEYAYSYNGVCALISPKQSKYSNGIVKLSSSGNNIEITNFVDCDSIKKQTWYYEENKKHAIKEDIIVKGNTWSTMDLNPDIAQLALTNSFGFKGKRCAYAYYNDQWYQFYNHHDNLYHGFPIVDKGNDPDLNRIKKLFGEKPENDIGQILL